MVSGTERDQEYLARRPMSLDDCRGFEKEWLRLIDGEQYVCIAGVLIRDGKNDSGKMFTTWVFDRYKTKKGCESYFEEDCDLQYQLRHGCQL